MEIKIKIHYKKICLKESEVWPKVVSDKITVTNVTRGLPSSFLSRPVALSSLQQLCDRTSLLFESLGWHRLGMEEHKLIG